ncbi:DNA/RNA polymerase [Auriculariales sp. MPI-PUGE-AT-0066]|nr:DNA/RNA polymerase [Auriculariales sp. MPI-PUGE-AT-0066]
MWLAGARRSRRMDARWTRRIASTTRSSAPATATLLKIKDLPSVAVDGHDQREELIDPSFTKYFTRPKDYLIVPTPLPADRSSPSNSMYFADSSTLDQVAIVDACLFNGYNLNRAKGLFDNMRTSDAADSVLDVRIFNNVLEGYVRYAIKVPRESDIWLDEAWDLFESMERGQEKATPTAATYAVMLLAYVHFSAEGCPTPMPMIKSRSPEELIQMIKSRKLDFTKIVQSHVLLDATDRVPVVALLSRAAELGQSQEIFEPTPQDDLPDIQPVLVYKPLAGDEAVPTSHSLQRMTAGRRALSRFQHETELFTMLNMAPELKRTNLRHYMWEWHTELTARLATEIDALEKLERFSKPSPSRPLIAPFLRLLKTDKLSILTIMEVMRLHTIVESGIKITRGLMSVGQAVELEHAAQLCKQRGLLQSSVASPSQHRSQSAQTRLLQLRLDREHAKQQAKQEESWRPEWSHVTRVQVGAFLVDLLMDLAKVTRTITNPETGETALQFTHAYEFNRGQKLGIMKFNPVLEEVLEAGPVRDLVHPRHLPMLVRPNPWIDHDNGGYMFSRASVMRIKDSQEQLTYLRQASQAGNLEMVYSGLDVLGATPWQINRGVLEVVIQVWNSGEGMGGIPPAKIAELAPQPPPAEDLTARPDYIKALAEYNMHKAGNHADRCGVNYKLEIAKAFLNETFYFPHNIDFRGRAYPIPPHLNHMGDDLSRSLLLFAESRPLGASGLRWLMIHLSNMFGYDKASFDDRVKFTEEHLEEVMDSADNPLTVRSGLVEDGRGPMAAVGDDGTCNGLQHYAALGGDVVGAQQVNLDVTERPADVYSFVANMVDEQIAKDVEKGNVYAKMVHGKITRKIVKQTVMTTVYGVTYIGAREQILRQLRDRRDQFDSQHLYLMSAYLARTTLSCIGDLFQGASHIQNWLTESARLISRSIPPGRVEDAIADLGPKKGRKSKATKAQSRFVGSRIRAEQMTAVVWTTLLGLPIVQPYRKVKRSQIITGVQSVYISDPHARSEVDSRKQAAAFPPNFIHSLDATHMMLTALECRAHNLTFASVHDSYWTHASTIDHMSVIIRDTFIALHESNVLLRLAEEFRVRYDGHVLPTVATGVQASSGNFIVLSKKQITALPGNEHQVAVKLTGVTRDGTINEEEAAAAEENMDEDDEDGEDAAEEDGLAPMSSKLKSHRMTTPEYRMSKMVDLWALMSEVPTKGDFDVKRIRNSQYFFS